MKTALTLFAAGLLACLTAAPAMAQQPATAKKTQPVVYVAYLHGMNRSVVGSDPSGVAHFTVRGDRLTIRINMRGVPPDLQHWQHFHGFVDGRTARCPGPDADVNHDGIIDLLETEPASGVTMVPFNAKPAAMDVTANTYPRASARGTYIYRATVSMKALQAAFGKAFKGASLDLDKRVVYIHGVPADTKLPATVKSLGTIPAQVTLPIACGAIRRVSN
ncbi:MAG: hypothetical protein ACRETQ_06440 [Gammaproteobacteria bacterium]